MDFESQRVAFWCQDEDRLTEFYQRLQQAKKRAIPDRHPCLYRSPGLRENIIAYKIRVRRQRVISKVKSFLKRQVIRNQILPNIRHHLSQVRYKLLKWLKRSSNFAR